MKSPRRRTRKLLALTALLLLGLAFGVYTYITGFHQIRHEQVRISSRGAELAATISLPRWGSGPFPAVIAVHSSGPRRAQDLRIVWRNLVPEGVVVLTYDKPGVGDSTGRYKIVARSAANQLPIDRALMTLGWICAHDFQEILVLCGNGLGIGGLKLLRGLYEKAVVMQYLSAYPDEVQEFFDYNAIHFWETICAH